MTGKIVGFLAWDLCSKSKCIASNHKLGDGALVLAVFFEVLEIFVLACLVLKEPCFLEYIPFSSSWLIKVMSTTNRDEKYTIL